MMCRSGDESGDGCGEKGGGRDERADNASPQPRRAPQGDSSRFCTPAQARKAGGVQSGAASGCQTSDRGCGRQPLHVDLATALVSGSSLTSPAQLGRRSPDAALWVGGATDSGEPGDRKQRHAERGPTAGGMPSLASSSSVFGRFTGKKQAAEPEGAVAHEEGAALETVGEGVGLAKSTILANGHRRRKSSILSLTSSVSDIGYNVRRSASLRSHRTQPSSGSGTFGGQMPRFPASGTAITSPLTTSPVEDEEHDLQAIPPNPVAPRSRGKFATATRSVSHKFKSTDTLPTVVRPDLIEPLPDRPPTAIDISKAPSMLAPAIPKRTAADRPVFNQQHTFPAPVARDMSSSHIMNGGALQHVQTNPGLTTGGHNPHTIYQQIHETSSKRMATIDYLRKVHEGNLYYFSTLHYSPAALHGSVPSLHPLKMGRRANNYLILGNSLPALLDLNSGSPLEYLKALYALLQEFETYQNLSGVDTTGSSLSRGRMGQMFKSGMGLGIGKGRRASTVTDAIALPSNGDMLGVPKSAIDAHTPPEASPITPSGHEFIHLVTPHVPFEPDFITTFATLCDTLIDTYVRLLDLVASPDQCSVAVGEAFGKADKAVRKILVANLLREFEDTTRTGVKGEVAGLGRLVLGGLM